MTKRGFILVFFLGALGLILGLAGLISARNAQSRLTDVREELLTAIQGIRANDLRTLSSRVEATRTDLSAVQSDLKGISASVKSAEARVAQMESTLAGVTKRLEASETGWRTTSEALGELRRELQEIRSVLAATPISDVELRLQRVERALREMPAAIKAAEASPRIAVVDAEGLFLRVFLPQVAEERRALQAKAEEIAELQRRYAEGEVKGDPYQQWLARLQAEYLLAQAQVNLSMLEKMWASPAFAGVHGELEALRQELVPHVERVRELVRAAQVVVLNYIAFLQELQELQAGLQAVDQVLTQIAAMKILEAAQRFGEEQGYDLVLRTKEVVMYRRHPMVTDLTPEVERELWKMFP